MLFSAVHATFSKNDHILGQNQNINTYEEMEIITYLLHENNEVIADKQQEKL